MGSFILLEKETKQIPFRFISLGREIFFRRNRRTLLTSPWLWPGLLFDEI
jgi:hypothetical protein